MFQQLTTFRCEAILKNPRTDLTREEHIEQACAYIHKMFSGERAKVIGTKHTNGFYTVLEIENAIIREASKTLEVFAWPVLVRGTFIPGFDRHPDDFKTAVQIAWLRSEPSGGYPLSMVAALEVKPQKHRQEYRGNGNEFRNDGVHYEAVFILDAGCRSNAKACVEQFLSIAKRQRGHSLLDNSAAFKLADTEDRHAKGSIAIHHIAESDLALYEGIHHAMYCAKDDIEQKNTQEYIALLESDPKHRVYVTTETKRGRRAVLDSSRRRRSNRWIKEAAPERPQRKTRPR